MKILHIHLTPQGKENISLRYFWDNPFEYQEYNLSIAHLQELRTQSETDYYTRLPVDYTKTGQALYQWLDQSASLLSNTLSQPRSEELIIAIATDEGLANQPWELLHDGESFLVEKRPSVIPVRWVATGQVPISVTSLTQNRPLRVLFMATSPLGVEPILDYESEEGRILNSTQRNPIDLRVEESGCLSELSYVVKEFESEFFDVFHLTGHAAFTNGKPCFLTESEYGDPIDSHAEDLVDALQFPLPPLLFLSGCRTGYAGGDTVSSMAEVLIKMGALAVLGWGERVRDEDATLTAGALYKDLATGRTLAQAVASTYQTLIQQSVPDWHKLRLYVGNTLPAALVTSLRTKNRQQLSHPSMKIEFRDDEGRLRVVSREEFVGRRRQLQNCLRAIKTDLNKAGVLIYGMGGWGKSSIASRLWDRLPDYKKILWWRQLNEASLIKKIKDSLRLPLQLELSPHIENSQITLKSRIVYLFNYLAEQGEPPFLFIFDDFEWNLEPYSGYYTLKPEVASILSTLVESIESAGTGTRILITCRYEFKSELLENFFSQGLEPLRNAELAKKLNRLQNFCSDELPDEIRKRALALADGNPRLLEFLNDEILSDAAVESKLSELEQYPSQWSDRIIWAELYKLIDVPLQQILSHCLVFEVPVPMAALEAVCQTLPDYQYHLQRARQLGLLEVSAEAQAEAKTCRVSRILPELISDIRLPEVPAVYSIYQTAHEALSELWGHSDNRDKLQWLEIFRLKFWDRGNLERFREGFSQMLRVQKNEDAERAFEALLKYLKDDLPSDNLCMQLERYLCQERWQEADEETAWLFYLTMIQCDYNGWRTLFKNFPGDLLNEIDQLWVTCSQGKFGFSIQKYIWQNLWESGEGWDFELWGRVDEQEVLEEFRVQVGWDKLNNYNQLSFFEDELLEGSLPARVYTRWEGVGVGPGEWYEFMRMKDSFLCLTSLIERGDLTYKM